MSEPLERPVDTPAPEAPAESTPDPDLQHATERLERVTEGQPARGTRPAPGPAPPAVAPAAPEEQAPAAAPATPRRPPATPEAQALWQEYRAREKARIEQEVTRRLLQRLDEHLGAQPREEAPAAPATAGEDPEPDFDEDAKAWYLWRGREDRRELLQQLNPVIEGFRQQGETQRQFQERQQQEQQEQQAYQRVIGDIAQASQLYTASDEGQGYEQRLAWYAGHGGDPRRGIPAEDGVIARGLISRGVPPEKARQINSAVVVGLADFALQNNINPAWLVDGVIQQTLSDFAGLEPEPQPTPAPVREAPAAREVQGLRRTATSAASVSGSLSQAASKRQPPSDPLRAAAKTGSVDAVLGKMRELRKADGRQFRSLLADLRRVAEGERTA